LVEGVGGGSGGGKRVADLGELAGPGLPLEEPVAVAAPELPGIVLRVLTLELADEE